MKRFINRLRRALLEKLGGVDRQDCVAFATAFLGPNACCVLAVVGDNERYQHYVVRAHAWQVPVAIAPWVRGTVLNDIHIDQLP